MHVEVQIPGAERIESLRSHIQRRLHSSIGQHADRVRRVSVRLSEFCGPARGSIWTSCRIEAGDESLPKAIVAEAFEDNPYRAFDKAIDRLSHSLDRELVRPSDGRRTTVVSRRSSRSPNGVGLRTPRRHLRRRRRRGDHGNPRSGSGSAMGRDHRCIGRAVGF
jgi:ribosome-associated translation inhibitor RaiA